MNSRAKLTNILITAMILENLCLHILYKQGILTQGKNAILLFVSSLVLAFAFLYRNFGVLVAVDEQPAERRLPYEYLMSVGNFVSVAMFCELLRGISYGHKSSTLPA